MIAVEIIIPLSFFLASFGVVYLFLTTRNRERMAMIEKGADPSMFVNRNIGFKIGMLLVGAAIGLIIGLILIELTTLNEAIVLALILLFGGLGLVAENVISRKRDQVK
jgi:tetrahydromethanopterin S-methyltransferase subunit G